MGQAKGLRTIKTEFVWGKEQKGRRGRIITDVVNLIGCKSTLAMKILHLHP